MATGSWAMAQLVRAGDLKVGDFVESIPPFTARGPRGGITRYRGVVTNSAVETITSAGGWGDAEWLQFSFMSHRRVTVIVPAHHKVNARVMSGE